jgi:PiT family inorganic phosphate transporter
MKKQSNLEFIKLSLSLMFIFSVLIFTYQTQQGISITIVFAAMIGAYMAMNIGANDVANNVSPAVGSKAMSMTTAIFIAAIFEAAGALIAGGSVVSTIKGGIINPNDVADPQIFIWLMMAALLAAALWLNLATAMGAPVSTTHSIIGGVMGGGIAAGGWAVVNWNTVGAIAASWVVSPLLGGLIAAGILYLIKRSITYQEDMMLAARKAVPWLLALMGTAFGTYLVIKGIKPIWKVNFLTALLIGLGVGLAVYLITRSLIERASLVLNNSKQGVNKMFNIPLIFAAALLSFAHGSNDVANAVGPLAAIYDALSTSEIHGKSAIPLWIMMIGALGLALGLALYGPKLIKTVGTEITDIDQMRAFSIALAATLTVILASQLGLPISTTHVTIGAIFGVGFLREYLKGRYEKILVQIRAHHTDDQQAECERFIREFESARLCDKERMLKALKQQQKQRAADNSAQALLTNKERKDLKKVYQQELVKRSMIVKVVSAWVITLPATGLMAAGIFYALLAINMH